MLITIKFGGTSVGSAERIRAAAAIVKSEVDQGHQVAVITSAMSGVTNKLVALTEQVASAEQEEQSSVAEFFRFTKQLEQQHRDTAREAITDDALFQEADQILYAERHALERVLLGSHFLGELTPAGYDFIVSQGERMSVPILAYCLKDLGCDAVAIGSEGCGIVTDANYGNGRPLLEQTRTGVRETLLPLLQAGQTPVAGGFYGRSPQGRFVTLGRGGSDYSAALVAEALDADEIWIMTDVDGIKTTDPRLAPAAHTISEVPYQIAAEMSLLGSKVLHPNSVLPAIRGNIPLRIASSFEPDKPGTRLVLQATAGGPIVTGLTLIRGAALIRRRSPVLGGEPIVNTQMIEELRRRNVDLLANATAPNLGSEMWMVGPQDVERFLQIFNSHNSDRFEVDMRRGVAVLGVVGERVSTDTAVIASLLQVLDRIGSQPLAILQGASPNSVAVVVPDEEDRLPIIVRQLHTTFGLDASQQQ